MNLFQLGNFTLSSGMKSGFKINCDALTDGDIACLAEMIRLLAGPFRSVKGVPSGGLRLAAALEPFAGLDGPHLLVDDVLTTGGSMERMKDTYSRDEQRAPTVMGAVAFARGQCPQWVKAVFQMPECFWLKPRTRL